ncbi:anthranilate synthase component II [[Haemophilus] felis]|uniref:Anthranilate synthase component II n=1 Tax=[Haemophilus] felis TaxID=123822 RepID=A0A1T0B537_9PAST|nr:anthranilate synthase component II [[Haemophilus] felis]NBI41097.1 anthranilate synthase component II [[Haemophilus] felis]NBI42994.1 anthranilate synthase component II [[Haemophilus] felis]OOS05245.1 anthranilate synthase component II [[Haemophilus] felis]
MKKLLIINNQDSFTYNLVDLIRRLDVPFEVIDVKDLNLDQIELFSHILISPGPDVPRSYPQLFAMLNRYYQHKSILGVCLGLQTICEFFGGKLYNLTEVRHGKSKQLKVQRESLLFKGLPRQFQIGLYHSWAIAAENFPSQLQITGLCDDEVIMAIEHHSLPIYAVQFHPESFISEYGEEILRNWLG